MLPAPDKPSYAYVYRRLANQINKQGVVNPDAFTLNSNETGLSVFRVDIATPYSVLRSRIESTREKLASVTSDSERAEIEKWLEKNPDVETLLKKGYRIIQLPIAELVQMGFEFTEPERSGYNAGHLEIRENSAKGAVFEHRKQDIIDLLDTGTARILSVEECLM